MNKEEDSNEEMYDQPPATPETEPTKGTPAAGDNTAQINRGSAMDEEDDQNVEPHGQIIDTDGAYENAVNVDQRRVLSKGN